MVIATILLLYTAGALVRFIAAALVVEMNEYELSPRENILYGCDYKDPKASTKFASSGMPCSSLYTSSGLKNDLTLQVSLSYIESIQELAVVKGIRCFKLELVTACKTKWLAPNEESRYFNVLQNTRAECESSNVCTNCEIATQYSDALCETFTFGWVDRKKQVVFRTDVSVYQNIVGRSEYGGLSSYDDMIAIGGSYSENVYFRKAPEADAKLGMFVINPSSRDLLSMTLRRLLKFTNETRSYKGTDWYLYDNNHLFHKETLEAALIAIAPRRLCKKRSQAACGQRKLILGQSSQQAYNEYFTAAQLNITNWYLNYLDCRLKKMSYGVFNIIKSFEQQLNIPTDILEQELVDLAPGERIVAGNMNKYACYRVVFGSIISRGGCLLFKDGTRTLNMTNIGEITSEASCNKATRINATHIIRPAVSDKIELTEFSFPSLIEEEEILKYPPNITSSYAHLAELIKNSAQLNARETGGSLKQSVERKEETPAFITWFTNGSFFRWTSMLTSVATAIIVATIIYYAITRWIKRRRDYEASNPRTIFIEREMGTTDQNSSIDFK